MEECVESEAAVRRGSCLWKRVGRAEGWRGGGGGLSSIRGISCCCSGAARSSHVWSCLVGSTLSAGELLPALPFVDKAEVKQRYVTALSPLPQYICHGGALLCLCSSALRQPETAALRPPALNTSRSTLYHPVFVWLPKLQASGRAAARGCSDSDTGALSKFLMRLVRDLSLTCWSFITCDGRHPFNSHIC